MPFPALLLSFLYSLCSHKTRYCKFITLGLCPSFHIVQTLASFDIYILWLLHLLAMVLNLRERDESWNYPRNLSSRDFQLFFSSRKQNFDSQMLEKPGPDVWFGNQRKKNKKKLITVFFFYIFVTFSRFINFVSWESFSHRYNVWKDNGISGISILPIRTWTDGLNEERKNDETLRNGVTKILEIRAGK